MLLPRARVAPSSSSQTRACLRRIVRRRGRSSWRTHSAGIREMATIVSYRWSIACRPSCIRLGPHDPIRRHIAGAMASARRVDAAVAFVTRAGVDLAHREIDTSRCDVRIVSALRWPTNIKAVAELATRWPNAVWIHLAGDSPREVRATSIKCTRRRLLSKVRVTRSQAFVGSHNWTFAALDGSNLEATVEVSCRNLGFVRAAIFAHIDACVAESEPFDPSQVGCVSRDSTSFTSRAAA